MLNLEVRAMVMKVMMVGNVMEKRESCGKRKEMSWEKKGTLWEKKGNMVNRWGCNFLKWPRHIWRNCALLQLLYQIILPRFRQNWRISTCRTRSSGFWGFTATFTFSSRPPRPPPPSSDPTCSSLARYVVIGHFVFILSTTLDIADFYYTCPGSQLYCFHVRQLYNIRFDSGGQWTWENNFKISYGWMIDQVDCTGSLRSWFIDTWNSTLVNFLRQVWDHDSHDDDDDEDDDEDVHCSWWQVVQQAAAEDRLEFEDPVRFVLRTWPWTEQAEGLPQVLLIISRCRPGLWALTWPKKAEGLRSGLILSHSGSAQSKDREL